MGIVSAIAGPYTHAFNAYNLGETKEGARLIQTVSKEAVRGDRYGDSILDSVYRGGNIQLAADGIEYSKALNAFWPYAQVGQMGLVGRMDVASGIYSPYVMTAVPGTTAAAAPGSVTGATATIDENWRGELMFSSRLRTVPIMMRFYPYLVGNNVYWYQAG